MNTLTGLHLLLTYRCTYACDHCFVWSGPRASPEGLSFGEIDEILSQGAQLGTVRTIWLEGGEPFLHRDVLAHAIALAAELKFHTGVVTNGFWASSPTAARQKLAPLVEAGLGSLAVSVDALHGDSRARQFANNAMGAAQELGLSLLILRTESPPMGAAYAPGAEGKVMFRGRAAELLSGKASKRPWTEYTACPHEGLASPARVHVDPFGYVHLCQGLVLGNLFVRPLPELSAEYEPHAHPIVGPILAGGPAGLVERYGLACEAGYADACHLCYRAREHLRTRYPAYLAPAEMYGGATAAGSSTHNEPSEAAFHRHGNLTNDIKGVARE